MPRLERSLRPTTYWCRRRLGYTLIEFLVVVGILVLAVGSVLAFLTASLKSSNQANVTAEVKQNGQVVLDSLEKQIRNASNAFPISSLPAGAANGVNLRFINANSIYLACFNSVVSPAANGWIGIANVTSDTATDTATYNPLSNRDAISGVDITDCSITATNPTAGAGSPGIVTVQFTANQGISAPSRQDFKANAKFQTKIALRRY